MITAIAAVSRNWGIGKDGDLLFNIPEDKKFFRGVTLDHIVVMGRKTLLSLPGGKPFRDRRNIILSRDENFTCEGAEVCRSVEEALALIGDEDAYIAGGGEIYRAMLPHCDFALVTKVDADADADVFFPVLDGLEGWELAEASKEYDYNGLKYKFCTYFACGKL